MAGGGGGGDTCDIPCDTFTPWLLLNVFSFFYQTSCTQHFILYLLVNIYEYFIK